MRSSSGQHFIALDHVRALAAFMVFAWHFTHVAIPYSYTPELHAFPLALFDEGHTGVSLFMALSGYLFAKLLDDKDFSYPAFLYNRALRLLPLLAVVVIIVGTKYSGPFLQQYIVNIAKSVVTPDLPNGGWSITVESHFYLLLPVLLWMLRRSRWLPFALIGAAILLRLAIHDHRGEVQGAAYWTIIGRIDQFTFGMLAFHCRGLLKGRNFLTVGLLAAFCLLYWIFDYEGGYYLMPLYPSPSLWWVFLPTAEGFAYGLAIAWYDNNFQHGTGPVSRLVARLGEYSYSIYLLHVFVVFNMARLVNAYVMPLDNYYVTLLWAVPCFLLMLLPGWVSYRFIESPFLRLRKPYLRGAREADPSGPRVAESPVTG